MAQFIASFDMKYQKVKAKGYILQPNILAFMLLRRASLTPEEHMLVMTGLNFASKDTMYTDAIKSLKKFKGESIGCGGAITGTDIKIEPPTYYTDHSSRYRGKGYRGRRHDSGKGHVGGGDNPSYRDRFEKQGTHSGSDRRNWRGSADRTPGGESYDRSGRPLNKKDKNGEYILCTGCGSYRHTIDQCEESSSTINKKDNYGQLRLCGACGSFRHFVANCPYRFERQQAKMNESDNGDQIQFGPRSDQAYITNVVLFNGSSNEPNLTVESLNCALLDSCCTSNVCGESWIEYYIENLSEKDRKLVKIQKSDRIFQFGGETFIHSQGTYKIPADFGIEKVYISVDVIKSEIPLLLSRSCMKMLRANIDYESDRAMILGQSITLSLTASGHHCVNILPERQVDKASSVRLN